MAKRSRSAKGEIVDFELLSIKQQLMSLNLTVDVQERRNYIDHKESGKSTTSYIEQQETQKQEEAVAIEDGDSFLIPVDQPVQKKKRV